MKNVTELKGPIRETNSSSENLIIFLHGWGSDGNDLIQIAHLWEKVMSNTTFLAPDGPEPCPQNPSGRQWFDILTDDNEKMYQGLKSSFELS